MTPTSYDPTRQTSLRPGRAGSTTYPRGTRVHLSTPALKAWPSPRDGSRRASANHRSDLTPHCGGVAGRR